MAQLDNAWLMQTLRVYAGGKVDAETKALKGSADDHDGRGISLCIFDAEGEEADTEGCTVKLGWEHAQHPGLNGLEDFKPVDAAKGRWRLVFPSEMLVPGTVRAKIAIRAGEDEVLTSERISIDVDPSVVDMDAAPGDNALGSFAQTVKALDEALGRAEAAEGERDAAESERAAAEASRKTEEAKRAKAELARESAEAARENAVADLVAEVEAKAEAGDFDGATYTPSVSDEGFLSWTNDKGRENPDPVDIKGPQGEQGPAGDPGPKGDPGAGVPEGGSPGQTLSVGDDGEAAWSDPPVALPPGGKLGDVLVKSGDSDGEAAWATPVDLAMKVPAVFDANGGAWEDGSTERVTVQTFGSKLLLPETWPASAAEGYAADSWRDASGAKATADTDVDWIAPKPFFVRWRPPIPEQLADASWDDLDAMSAYVAEHPEEAAHLVGQTRPVTVQDIGTFDFRCIGVGQDRLADGGNAGFTLQSVDCISRMRQSGCPYETSGFRRYCRETVMPGLEDAVRAAVKDVLRNVYRTESVQTEDLEENVFLMHPLYADRFVNPPVYAYYAGHCPPFDPTGSNTYPYLVKHHEGEAVLWPTSDSNGSIGNWKAYNERGTVTSCSKNTSYQFGIAPCFCV